MAKSITLSLLSIVSIAFGLAPPASRDCSGVVKWNGSLTSPKFLWKLDSDNSIVFCPQVECDTQGASCHPEVTYAPPGGMHSHSCGCDDGGDKCTTLVKSASPWGVIATVECLNRGCTDPQSCELEAIGSPDPNGWYDVRCVCD